MDSADEVEQEVVHLRALLGRDLEYVDGRIEQACPACLVTLSLRMPVNDVAQLHRHVFRFFDDHRCYTVSMSPEQLAETIARAERASEKLAASAQALRARELAGHRERSSPYERAELESVRMAELAQWLAQQVP
jgi:hypothetical protein